jgi:hypothetical protein
VSGNVATATGTGIAYRSAGSEPGANQEAYLRLTSASPSASEQALLLKLRSPGNTKTSWIKVAIVPGNAVVVSIKAPKQTAVVKATFVAAFAAGDQLGARTTADGTVTVYRNGSAIATTNVTSGANAWSAALAGAGGRIGVSFVGAGPAPNDATFDDFGGGTLP